MGKRTCGDAAVVNTRWSDDVGASGAARWLPVSASADEAVCRMAGGLPCWLCSVTEAPAGCAEPLARSTGAVAASSTTKNAAAKSARRIGVIVRLRLPFVNTMGEIG